MRRRIDFFWRAFARCQTRRARPVGQGTATDRSPITAPPRRNRHRRQQLRHLSTLTAGPRGPYRIPKEECRSHMRTLVVQSAARVPDPLELLSTAPRPLPLAEVAPPMGLPNPIASAPLPTPGA